jgi:hypothetical protein
MSNELELEENINQLLTDELVYVCFINRENIELSNITTFRSVPSQIKDIVSEIIIKILKLLEINPTFEIFSNSIACEYNIWYAQEDKLKIGYKLLQVSIKHIFSNCFNKK